MSLRDCVLLGLHVFPCVRIRVVLCCVMCCVETGPALLAGLPDAHQLQVLRSGWSHCWSVLSSLLSSSSLPCTVVSFFFLLRSPSSSFLSFSLSISLYVCLSLPLSLVLGSLSSRVRWPPAQVIEIATWNEHLLSECEVLCLSQTSGQTHRRTD